VQEMKPRWPHLIPVGFVAAITLLSPIFHFVFYIDAEGVYHRGPLFCIVLIISYSYLLLGFLLLLLRRKNLIDMDFRFLLFFCLMPMVGGLAQGLIYGVLLLWASSAFALAIMYMYLQERMIQSDYLTGAWTRHSFEYYLSQKLKSNDRAPFGLIYVDIDNLKHINDRYGHQEGDNAIRSAVVVMKSVLRKCDAIARLGGDEFAVLLNVSTHEQLAAVLDRIGAAIRAYNETSGKEYSLSLSMGGELFDAVEENTMEAVVNKVDQLMYACKRDKQPLPADRRREDRAAKLERQS
jgi:diguanylate cyclase (GGDEF)-like protein